MNLSFWTLYSMYINLSQVDLQFCISIMKLNFFRKNIYFVFKFFLKKPSRAHTAVYDTLRKFQTTWGVKSGIHAYTKYLERIGNNWIFVYMLYFFQKYENEMTSLTILKEEDLSHSRRQLTWVNCSSTNKLEGNPPPKELVYSVDDRGAHVSEINHALLHQNNASLDQGTTLCRRTSPAAQPCMQEIKREEESQESEKDGHDWINTHDMLACCNGECKEAVHDIELFIVKEHTGSWLFFDRLLQKKSLWVTFY